MEREKLAKLLARVAAGDGEAQQALLTYIMAQPEGVRVLALEALETGGEAGYEQLMLTLADDPELTVRSGSPASAGESSGVPGSLLEQARGGERQGRIRALRALADYEDPALLPVLMAAIRSEDRQVATAAVESAQALGAMAVPALVELMESPDEQVRWHAAKGLSLLADARAVPALVRALEDKNSGTRWLAAEGLARAGRATLIPLLRRLAEGKPSAWLRHGSWHVLNKIELPSEEEQAHYKQLADNLKRGSAATLPTLARAELRRLGEDA